MSTPTPALWTEIAEHLRASTDIRHGMVLREMERGLDAEQIAASQCITLDFVREYIKSLEDLRSGRLTTAPSLAKKQARVYRYLLHCNLSSGLRSYVKSCLRQLGTTNPKVRAQGPFRLGMLRDRAALERKAAKTQQPCPSCHMVHAGECL